MSEDQPTNGELAQMLKGLREIVELRFDENEKDHDKVREDIKEFKKSAENKFAPKLRYVVVERLVYGLTGIILITVATAIVTGVVTAAEYLIKYYDKRTQNTTNGWNRSY